ncbi:MAG TPA: NAD(P)-binding domain-containing protein, partial [bacterium]|nr:NAD(P)-binding domain-containing protein [bacterium]
MDTKEIIEVGVIGGGSFGTAMAIHLARNGYPVTIWAHDA